MTAWTFADIWEHAAAAFPEAPAAVHGGRRISWADFDRRAGALAAALLDHGLRPGAKVAQYLPNRPEYLESFFAASKASLVPVNTNFRYLDDELVYLWDNADVEAVVFDDAYTDVAARVRPRVPRVRAWFHVGPARERPGWAVGYEDAATPSGARPAGCGRGDDDLLLLYTGGTTGQPKGVMWRQGDLLSLLNSMEPRRLPDRATAAQAVAHFQAAGRPGRRSVIACPLMHGTGLFFALSTLNTAGCVITLPSSRFDAGALLDVLEGERAHAVVIVGDAFARPMLDAMEAETGRWALSSLRVMSSSGAIWSEPVKRRLVERLPGLMLVDGLGSSEAGRIATSVATSEAVAETATFIAADDGAVLLDDGTFAEPGSGQVGHLAVSGWIPLGYYKDKAKSAAVFREVGGRRWSIPGDLATVDADGTIRLLGRGSGCINTAGEKVFPEEVEEALKTHPAVADAAVVGVPHERYGQAVVALVEPRGGQAPDPAELVVHVKGRLAGYKAPKLISVTPTVARGPNGKLDYQRLRREAQAAWEAGDGGKAARAAKL
ncbi:MAG: AMP-binding protein [Acidimicrobiia bacterium]